MLILANTDLDSLMFGDIVNKVHAHYSGIDSRALKLYTLKGRIFCRPVTYDPCHVELSYPCDAPLIGETTLYEFGEVLLPAKPVFYRFENLCRVVRLVFPGINFFRLSVCIKQDQLRVCYEPPN